MRKVWTAIFATFGVVAFAASLAFIGTGIATKVAGQEVCHVVAEYQKAFDEAGAPNRTFNEEQTVRIYAAVTAKSGPSPDGAPTTYLLVVSPDHNRAMLAAFDVNGCAMEKAYTGPVDQILPMVAAAIGAEQHD